MELKVHLVLMGCLERKVTQDWMEHTVAMEKRVSKVSKVNVLMFIFHGAKEKKENREKSSTLVLTPQL